MRTLSSGDAHCISCYQGTFRLLEESIVLKEVRDDVRRAGGISDSNRQHLMQTFQKRLDQAMELVNEDKVTKYIFNPSGRIVWVVTGKSGEYQVLPDSMFCSCDDYFFRVMSGKKQVCYHIIGQQLADALGKYRMIELEDTDYAQITAKWSQTQPLSS